MTPTPNPTAEQILTDEWILQADRAKAMTGMDAIWFPDAGETLAALRAHNLLYEGAPSEEQIERAAEAIHDLMQGDPMFGESGRRREMRIYAKAALTAAAVAPQEPLVLDPKKVAEVAEQAGDEWQTMFYQFMLGRGADLGPLYPFIARALCEAAKRGELS